MPRKLLFYTHALVGGGAERVMARLASGFAARGDTVTFAVDFDAPETRGLLSPDIRYEILPRGHFHATLALAKLLRSAKPDASLSAISVSNLKHSLAATLAFRPRRAALGHHGFSESEAEPLSRIAYLATPLLARLTGATIAVSHCLALDLERRFFAPRPKLHVLPNPAAPEPFPAAVTAAELASRPPRVAAIGRLVPGKDHPTLLKAFARVKTPGATLAILGDGPDLAPLQALAASLGVEGRVEFQGFRQDVGPVLAGAKVLAIASRRESFGLACVEALSHGLPVVSTDCGGPAEILGDPSLGSLVPVGGESALAHALDAALQNPGDPAPRQLRAADFTLEKSLGAYDALIRRLTGA